MAILIDLPLWPAHGTLFSHLISDSDYEELHLFATRLPVPRRAFDLDHYDVPASLYERAISLGATPVASREVVHALRDSGLRVRQVEREAVRPLRRREYLRTEWSRLGSRLGVGTADSPPEWSALGDELLVRWNEPHRAYHDLQHLEDVLLALDQLSTRGEQIEPVALLAAWFHDAVYHGSAGEKAGDDERESAEFAVRALSAFPLPAGLVQQVGTFVMATMPAVAVEDPTAPLAHLLDADLAIFASPVQRYSHYAASVRVEYAHVPDEMFARGRAEILESYIGHETIYRSDAARGLWEERARVNLLNELATLRHTISSSMSRHRHREDRWAR